MPSAQHPGTWYHIAGVYDSGAQTLTLYVNGASVATSDVTGYRPITGGGLSLSWGRETYAGHDLAGTLDDSRVYSRALSAPPTLVTSPAKC
jgi:hypothetical protein